MVSATRSAAIRAAWAAKKARGGSCKYGKGASGRCNKKMPSGLGRSKALKYRWEAKRASGAHKCKYGKNSSGYCKKKSFVGRMARLAGKLKLKAPA
jgi:hypothetical protein